MIKGKHVQQAFGGIDPDNFGMCGVGGGGSQVFGTSIDDDYRSL
jgi:hypothetical protein